MSTGKSPTIALTASGSDMTATTAWQEIPLPPGGEGNVADSSIGPQILQLSAVSTSSSGSGTGALRWYDEVSGAVIKEVTFTITVTSVRTALAGSSGNYVCTIASSLDGTDKFDLLPYGDGNANATTAPRNIVVYVGLKTLTTMTNATFYPEWTRAL